MKLNTDITINGKRFNKGDEVSGWKIYPFFLLHMGIFGGSGFAMAYFTEDLEPLFLFAHGGFAIIIYVVFYLAFFGKDEVKWMFTNAALGIFGIYAEVSWILEGAGKSISSYPLYTHVIPFLYYVLYQFLLRQMFIDLTGSRDNPVRMKRAGQVYIALALALYTFMYFR